MTERWALRLHGRARLVPRRTRIVVGSGPTWRRRPPLHDSVEFLSFHRLSPGLLSSCSAREIIGPFLTFRCMGLSMGSLAYGPSPVAIPVIIFAPFFFFLFFFNLYLSLSSHRSPPKKSIHLRISTVDSSLHMATKLRDTDFWFWMCKWTQTVAIAVGERGTKSVACGSCL